MPTIRLPLRPASLLLAIALAACSDHPLPTAPAEGRPSRPTTPRFSTGQVPTYHYFFARVGPRPRADAIASAILGPCVSTDRGEGEWRLAISPQQLTEIKTAIAAGAAAVVTWETMSQFAQGGHMKVTETGRVSGFGRLLFSHRFTRNRSGQGVPGVFTTFRFSHKLTAAELTELTVGSVLVVKSVGLARAWVDEADCGGERPIGAHALWRARFEPALTVTTDPDVVGR
jgi:hypothetical protein